MPVKARSFGEYLAALGADQRFALERLRKAVLAAAPDAEECISYALPAFRLGGRPLVAMGATANHCAFYPMSSTTVEALADELKGFDTSKGTIRFPANRPLPASLVKKVVRARMAEVSARSGTVKRRGTGRTRGAIAGPDAVPTDPAVEAFLRELDHPLKRDIEAVRRIILGVSPGIREGIKWNSVSFRTTDYFATVNLRSRDAVQLVFHKGAKVKDNSTEGQTIPDPAGLIKWLARERCLVTVGAGKDIPARTPALEDIVRAWIG